MTKVTILGQDEPKKELKKIEFVKYITGDRILDSCSLNPDEYDNIILIKKNYSDSSLDLMYAYSNDDINCLYLGHFNDGVV
jgi:hypothetical protein